jgi:histidine triad (HIT) family protein
MENCIFCKIVRGQIPCRKVWEDEDLLAFHDIQPQAPVHFLIIPKLHVVSLAEVDAGHHAMLGKMLGIAGRLAHEQGATDGFRTIINTGRVGGQEVYHLHMHVFGGSEPLGRMVSKRNMEK